MAGRYPFDPFPAEDLTPEERARRLESFGAILSKRRTVREYADTPVDRELILRCIDLAGKAPSGANLQPWHFVLVEDPEIKRRIREAAEAEEYENYHGRMPQEWLEALAPLGTNEHKPFLETAPYLIVVFKIEYGLATEPDGGERKIKHYYVNESVGLAAGFLLAALQMAGLATLTHTPSPMGFLSRILGAPKNYKPFLLIPVGLPAEDAKVPRIPKKGRPELVRIV